MPVVNPGIRRFLGSAIQRLFNSASVSLPLTHTAIPTRGSIVPTFTRATTETGQKWDEAGYLDFTALAGEMVFKGARREYNQWTTSSASLASGANKSLTLAAGTYQFSMGAGSGTATFSGTGGATGTLAASTGRVSVAKTITAGTFVVTASVADLADLQVCDITGETDQTTIRPYVSVGVESAPAYHGSMVDGVKCYDTDRSGNPISTTGSYPLVGYVPWEARTNRCLQSNAFTTAPWALNFSGLVSVAQNATAPDGTTTAWTFTDDLAALEAAYQSVALADVTTYTLSAYVAKTVGATNFPALLAYKAVTGYGVVIDTNNGAAKAVTTMAGGSGIGTPTNITVENVNATFWRVSFSFLTNAAAAWVPTFAPAWNSTYNTAESGAATGSTVACWFQLELGSFASSYIPTTTTAVTRAADVLVYPSAGNISDTAGWCYAEATTDEATSSQSAIVASSLGVGLLEMLGASTTISTDDGALGVTKTGLSDMRTGSRKRASTWGNSVQSVTGDGATPASGAYDGGHGTVAIAIGSGTGGGIPWYGTIRNVRIGQRQLSASEMQAITA